MATDLQLLRRLRGACMHRTVCAYLALQLALFAAPRVGGDEGGGGGVPAPPKEPAFLDDLPPGFYWQTLATGITGATAMAIAADGRVLICEQTGALRVWKDGRLLDEPALVLEVDSWWERGLIGIALDPRFDETRFVYLVYVRSKLYPHHRVSRFVLEGDRIAPGSERVLLEGDDQRKLGGSVPAGHQGGPIAFGSDGALYIGIGEQTAGAPAERLDTLQGKLLRILPDGTIPPDNPFVAETEGKYRAIWARGLRNPFGLAVDRRSGRIFFNDVGGSKWEEVNEAFSGAHYGWPHAEGPASDPRFRGPLHAYPRNIGKSITAGLFYDPPVRQFPARFEWMYFFAEYMTPFIACLDPDDPAKVETFATGLTAPVDLDIAPDGSLLVLNRNAWVRDDKFRPGTGSLLRIAYAPDGAAAPVPRIEEHPRSQAVARGEALVFRVSAAGESPLAYRWTRDGSLLPDAAGRELVVPAARKAEHGTLYSCIVTNRHGSVRSLSAIARVLEPIPARSSPPLRPGLAVRWIDGSFAAIPDFDALGPELRGVASRLDEVVAGVPHDCAVALEGFLDVPERGAWSFRLESSAPAKLSIAGREVAAVIGTPGAEDGSGTLALAAGPHAFRLAGVLRGASRLPRVEWSRPGGSSELVPGSALFHADPAALLAPEIEPPGGSFTGPLEVRISTSVRAAAVRYSFDGSVPEADAPHCRDRVRVARSLTLTAVAFGPGGRSPPVTARFEVRGTVPYGLSLREAPSTVTVPLRPKDCPRLLSETGLFASLDSLEPNPGVVPYGVNAPLWSDGARKRRWVVLPEGARASASRSGSWRFPEGTVFVKHFELDPEAPGAPARRLETRLLVVAGGRGNGYGVTYRWREDATDAELLPGGLEATVGGADWTFPSREECIVCHTRDAGFVLGVSTRQLNRVYEYPSGPDNQLRAWSHAGLLERAFEDAEISELPRLARIDDASAPLALRVRSYLDQNCAQCHRPGGARAAFDARFDTPIEEQGLIGGPVFHAELGIARTEVVAPGEPQRSALYLRMATRGSPLAMPPLATNRVDAEALEVIAAWIESLAR